MKESLISLTPIISNSIDTDNESDLLINNNKNNNIINTNNINHIIINTNTNSLVAKNKILVPTSKVVTISYRGKNPERIVDRTILCSRRRKLPKKLKSLRGVTMTLGFFIFFSIFFTITLSDARNIKAIEDSTSESYKNIIIFMWIFAILSIITLLDVATADPGRQRGTPIIQSKFDKANIKKIVKGQRYMLKYCTTCNLIRDVRTFHCNTCGLCVEKHDHHCGYISNCVGVYNYKKFLLFVIIAYIHVSIIFITCVHFVFKYGGSLESEEEYILLILIFIMLFGGFFEFFVFWMIVQHIQVISVNRTTREFIKNKEYKVYDRGCKKNCNEALCQNNIREI
jgi:hypothetical protein